METWLFLAIIAVFAGGMGPLISRRMTSKYGWLVFAFFLNISTGVVFFLTSFQGFHVPPESIAVLYALGGMIAVTFSDWSSFRSSEIVEVSERIPLKRLDIVFILILSYIFFLEKITEMKILGAAMIFLGTVLISYEKGRHFARLREKGTQLTILSAVFAAVVFLFDKAALRYWSVVDYSIIIYLGNAVIFGILLTRAGNFSGLRKMAKTYPLLLLAAVAIEVTYILLKLTALTLADVSSVFLVLRLTTLVTVVAGIILLRERTRILEKILSAIIMILGAALVAL